MSELSEQAENGVEVFLSPMHKALHDFMIERDIEDMSKETQSRWSAALIYIYNHVFKNNKALRRKPYDNNNLVNGGKSNNNAYDLDVLNTVCDYYIALCYEYNKEISINGFCKLTGVNHDKLVCWKDSNNNYISTTGRIIYKKLLAEREESLSNILISGRKNPIGILGILNRWYGWNMGQPKETPKQIQTQTTAQVAAKYGVNMLEGDIKQDEQQP